LEDWQIVTLSMNEQVILRDFVYRPYWKRAWIVQEALLARMSKAIFGMQEMGFPTLATYIEELRVELYFDHTGALAHQ
jgi:hypothetical protein